MRFTPSGECLGPGHARTDDAFFTSRYAKTKCAWLERKTKDRSRSVSPGNSVYKSLTYPDREKSTGAEAVLNLAVCCGPFLILGEAKGRGRAPGASAERSAHHPGACAQSGDTRGGDAAVLRRGRGADCGRTRAHYPGQVPSKRLPSVSGAQADEGQARAPNQLRCFQGL